MVLTKVLSCSASEAKISSSSSRFNLYHSYYRVGWNPGKSLLESYKSTSGQEFHCIYGYDMGEREGAPSIGTLFYAISDQSETSEVVEFVHLTFRDEIKKDYTKSLLFLVCESEKHLSLITTTIDGLLDEPMKLAPTSFFDHHLFVAPSSPQEDIPLPEEYFLAPLKQEHIEYMADLWAKDLGSAGATPIHHGFMQKNIAERPSLGVYLKEGPETPVAWCICYTGGSLGSMHVVDEHRGKKLARIILRSLVKKVVEVHGIVPFANVHFDNKASACLLASEGWIKTPVNYSKMFVDPGVMNL